MLLRVLILGLCCVAAVKSLPGCKPNQIKYTYTECDQNGGRWRVPVPVSPDTCEISEPEPPIRGMDCDFACEPGEYLKVETQKCIKCPTGTYSLGSGVRFDSWDNIPDGFHLTSESVSFEEYGYHSKVGNCSTSQWTGSKDSIRSNTDDCTSSLSYDVNLKVPGSVTFVYQYTDEDVIFHFYVRNGQCQTYHDDTRNIFLNTTGTSSGQYTAKLEPGDNILVWKTTGILVGGRQSVQPVVIKSIEISGVSYSTNCMKCKHGFYSDKEGQKSCKPCPVNTHSGTGAAKCSKCDTETEYAPSMSATCLQRPPCKASDYFETHSACNEDNKYLLNFKWMDPKICRDDLEDSVPLPVSNKMRECSPCNPGYYPAANNTCLKCPYNQFSDGLTQCQTCAANTAPNYGYFYTSWDRLPSNVKVSCLPLTDGGCSKDVQGWVPVGNAMKTTQGQHLNSYLIFMVVASTYKDVLYTEEDADVYGKVTFAFETDCSADCQLFFMMEVPKVGTTMLESWQGNQPRQTYSYQVLQNRAVTYTWAFQKSSETNPETAKLVAKDSATIYLVNITNVEDGVADTCKTCAQSKDKNSECIGCEKGSFVDPKTNECTKCKDGYVLKEKSEDISQCMKCEEGTTHNSEHTACHHDCRYTSPMTNRQYNFSALSAPVTAATLPLFTETGTKYYHSYNFSLCGNNGFGIADCVENVSAVMNNFKPDTQSKHAKGMLCRSTESYTAIGGTPVTIHTKPVLISNEILNITHSDSDYAVFPKNPTSERDDIVYYFKANDLGKCKEESVVAVHLRCDPKVEGVEVTMPTSCPDGTCDGCNFEYLWKTIHACPICTEDDYISIQGACENSQMTTHYVWKTYPRNCKDGIALPDDVVVQCTPIKFYIEIGVFAGAALLVIFVILLCRLWKRSKKLEYKYHRLMHSNGKNGMELPTADSCAMSESESDGEPTDEVIFQKKRSKMLGGKSTNSFDSVPLTAMTEGV